MKIISVEQIPIGCPRGFTQGAPGRIPGNPPASLPGLRAPAGRAVCGVCAGDRFYAVPVRVTTDEGIHGVASVGAGNGAACYIIERHLAPIVTGQNPFDVELLWEQMFRSAINYGRKGV